MPSNSPVFLRKSWAELARSELEFRIEADKRRSTATATDTIFFGIQSSGEGSASVYIELFYASTTRVLSACMFLVVAPERGFVSEERIKLVDVLLTDPPQAFINLTSYAPSYTYWFDIRLELVALLDGLLRPKASARLHKNESAFLTFSPKILTTFLPSRDLNLLVRGKLLAGSGSFCPNCFGIGAFDEMAIPKADWESGLTGYALFSCNRVSGRVACTVCGGTGGRFEAWYLVEHPELIGTDFSPGSGLLTSPST